MERVGDLEAEGPRGAAGRGVGLPSKTPDKKVVESKVILNLAELTDDKNKFRQWDIKPVSYTHLTLPTTPYV